jgi:hypothetical protein
LACAEVAVFAGLGFGEHGEGYVRIALVEETHRLRQAVRRIRAFVQSWSNQTEPAVAGAAAGLDGGSGRVRPQEEASPDGASKLACSANPGSVRS